MPAHGTAYRRLSRQRRPVDFQATLKDVLVCDVVLMALTSSVLPSTEHVAVFFSLFVTCPRSFRTICHVNLFVNNNNNNNNNRKSHYSIDHTHTILYSSSIVNMPVGYYILSPRYSRILVENRYLLVFGAPVRREAVRFTQQPLVTKNSNDGPIRQWKNFDDMFSRFDRKHACDRRTECDGQTDGISVAYARYPIAYMMSHVKWGGGAENAGV